MNCLSAFLKILKLLEWNEGNFKILKSWNWFIPKIDRTKHVVTGHFVLRLTYFNSGELQNGSVNAAMLTTINHVIIDEIYLNEFEWPL